MSLFSESSPPSLIEWRPLFKLNTSRIAYKFVPAVGPPIALDSVKNPVTVIWGSDGAPWGTKLDPRSRREVAGSLLRPPKLRVYVSQAWLTLSAPITQTSLTFRLCWRHLK